VRDFVFLDDAPIFGGAERNVLRLARFVEESSRGRSARVICPDTSELARRCGVAGIAVVDARFPAAPHRIPGAVLQLRRLLADLSDDSLVVGVTLRSQVYGHAALLALLHAPRVVHFMPEQDSARRLTAKVVLRRYGAVVAVGENTARTYSELAPNVRVRRVDNFLLPEDFAAAAAKRTPRSSGDPPVVGVLTRLFPGKGVLELVGELADCADAWSQGLVGAGRQVENYAAEVERRIAAAGLQKRVHLLGHVDELAAFFAEIDVLVVPSVGAEGQPTVILEALAYGRPVIVRESVWSSDFDGLPVVAYRDARELREALRGLEPATVAPEELARRFGPGSVIEAIEAAADDR
jgi:glycosyltransferase involved in cell wall biosynthesis